MSFTMPGTTESIIHESMVNMLKQNNLWLTSDKIAAKRKDNVCFVLNGNSNYTHHPGSAEKLMTATIKLASTDSTVVAVFGKIKDKNFIQCTSKRIYGTKVVRKGILIQTTNNKQQLQTSHTAPRNVTTKLNLTILCRKIKIGEESYEFRIVG